MTGSQRVQPRSIAQLLRAGVLRCERRGAWRWYLREDDDAALQPWIDDLDRAFDAQTPGIRQLKADVCTNVALTLGPRPLVFKRFNWNKWYAPPADVVRGTRAARAFRLGLALDAIRVPTAPVVAFGERVVAGMPICSCLVMHCVEKARTLAQLMRDGAEADIAAALARMADMIATLHDAGFSHRDLKSHNVLVSAEAATNLTLIDLDGLRYLGVVSRARRGKNLARLRQDVVATDDGDARWEQVMQRYETASGCRNLELPTYRKQRG